MQKKHTKLHFRILALQLKKTRTLFQIFSLKLIYTRSYRRRLLADKLSEKAISFLIPHLRLSREFACNGNDPGKTTLEEKKFVSNI